VALQRLRGLRPRLVLGFAGLALLLAPGWAMGQRLVAAKQPSNTTLAQRWIETTIPAGTQILMDWAYVPVLQDAGKIEDRLKEARAAGSPMVGRMEDIYCRRPSYRMAGLLGMDYDLEAMRSSSAAYLVTSQGCYGRFLTAVERDVPRATDPLYPKFAARRAFYVALLQGQSPYTSVRTFEAGSGPLVKVFARSAGE